ncbi:hypothetical protein LYSHEL_15430 [Lysobacter helvus]|uniref:Uncharacterized protein n=2 Tax=Lysobacteraceae TaxID=32033 RepID=A0ABN6FU95_9GAMM|nr:MULTISPECIES: hypothetical protein [Lysobacter]BCT92519.1 hypothetical protein LYSCAS_15430 [Lysobacter caseinilyticus]BCT95672.1 hypothetical protein LYSHEL_15430 [Lysobacter helvus]
MRIALVVLWFVATAAAAAPPQSSAKATLLSGPWTGHSTCVDKVRHPACKDETIVYRFVRSAPHVAILYADKILAGKREPMGALRMQLGADDRSAGAHFTWGRGTGTWAYTMTADTTLTGTLKDDPGGALARNVDAHRVDDKALPAAPPLADYGEPH